MGSLRVVNHPTGDTNNMLLISEKVEAFRKEDVNYLGNKIVEPNLGIYTATRY